MTQARLSPHHPVTPMSERWDRHFLELAQFHARMSKDPSTRVGSVIVGPDKEIISAGFNGFPRGIADTRERLSDRDMKLRLVVHGEMNAILAAARTGMRLKGCTLYLAATDDTGAVWGGPPCTRCTVEIIQAGLSEIVSYPVKAVPSKWHEDLKLSGSLLIEAGIRYREITTEGESNVEVSRTEVRHDAGCETLQPQERQRHTG